MNPDSLKIMAAHEKLEQQFPDYGKNVKKGKALTLEVAEDGKVVVVGPKGGRTRLFMEDNWTLNPKISKTDMKVLGSKMTELIQITDEEIEELEKSLQEDTRIANDENEQPSVHERAREKIIENTERKTQLEQEREQLVEKLPVRERLKALFKKYGFTIATVVAAVSITIGVIVGKLSNAASAAANGIKNVANKVGNGLKELGKKIGSILPGLVGAIASFVFRTAGQVISFLGKNASLLILFMAAFLIEKLTKKQRE